jgi:hypothetical protein
LAVGRWPLRNGYIKPRLSSTYAAKRGGNSKNSKDKFVKNARGYLRAVVCRESLTVHWQLILSEQLAALASLFVAEK